MLSLSGSAYFDKSKMAWILLLVVKYLGFSSVVHSLASFFPLTNSHATEHQLETNCL